jgi:hypothetical protein
MVLLPAGLGFFIIIITSTVMFPSFCWDKSSDDRLMDERHPKVRTQQPAIDSHDALS